MQIRQNIISFYILFFFIIFGIIFGSFSSIKAQEAPGLRPQMGVWFGPVSPFPYTEISNVLTTYLGGGLFFRMAWPNSILRTELGTSWSYYNSKTTSSLHLVPFYAAEVYRIPINFALKFFIKAGGGGVYVKANPEGNSRIDPLGFIGFEGSFPAGRRVNIGLRLDYLMVIESHLEPPKQAPTNYKTSNFYFMNVGLMVNFNFTR